MAPRGRAQCVASLSLVLVLALLGGCGRIGVELTLEDDAGTGQGGGDDAGPDADAMVELPRVCDTPACFAPGCPGDTSKSSPGVCGCGISDARDSDGDGVADCVDFCPGEPDVLESGGCACEAGSLDADGDGSANCTELCPFDPAKQGPGACGCGVAEGGDADGDGTPDCADRCPSDANKTDVGACGCGIDERDADLDQIPDCVDGCTVANQSTYVPDASCGVGYCRTHNTPSRCVDGIETPCVAALAPSTPDGTCDGVDDDCDGQTDEGFPASSTSCGSGPCASPTGGTRSCQGGQVVDTCVAGTPSVATDTSCNGVDDDCDGRVDDDYPVTATMCAMGACAATGSRACVMGSVVDSCAPAGTPAANDATCNNRDDDCAGGVDEDYVPRALSCGVGACRRSVMTSCVRGVESACTPGAPAASDATCNGVDDDCDGQVDEDFTVTNTSCGVGVCARTGNLTCVGGQARNTCVAAAPATTSDDAFVPGNGLDDDCDGQVDEDVPVCTASTRNFDPGVYTNLAVPGNCHTVTVRLWGGGGASGQPAGVTSARGGNGGAGGYATTTTRVVGPITLYVGTGAASGCDGSGTNAGSAAYNGGSGGLSEGAAGADGVVAGGGAAGAPSSGFRGGRGHYGGGGGGEGNGGLGSAGRGAGGGAASVLLVNGVRAAVAGGGGGGGGAQATTILGTIASPGGAGGSGCGGAGQVGSGIGGGGGGGGMCQGTTVQAGSGVAPAMESSLPSGRARGGSGDCAAGGSGFAFVSFSP